MMLKDKVAVVSGAGGSVGGAVARAFAREGARVFLTGHREKAVYAVAQEIGAEAEVVDAHDELAVEKHLAAVVQRTGRLDISFNATGISDQEVVGTALTELPLERFLKPIDTYLRSYFLSARHAARHMTPRQSGVIMTVTALHSRIGLPLVGGYGPAMAAKEALTRDLSAELAPHGVRVVGLRPQAMPESSTIREAYEPRAKATGLSWDQWQAMLAARTHPRRLMSLEEMANIAAFTASDAASGLTGTTLNLTLGSLDD